MQYVPNPSGQKVTLHRMRLRLKDACDSLVNHIKTVTLSKGRRGQGDVLNAGEPPYAFYGNLRKSVMQREKQGDPNTRQVGSPGRDVGVPYAAMLEKGGTIRGKKGLLTIPRTEEAITHMKGGGTSRNFPRPLQMIPSRGRPGIYFLAEYRRGGARNPRRTEIHFVLARSVTIKQHSWLMSSLQAHWPQMMKIMGGG